MKLQVACPFQSHSLLEQDRRPSHARAGTTGLLAFIAAIAIWMNLGRLHYFENSDSIIPVLASLQRWTPFYWGQDRWGMLVPLLATPFRHPLINLFVQGCLMTFAGLLCPFLLARYAMKDMNSWFAVGALANLGLLSLVPPKYQFDWFVGQPYALSLTLAVVSLLLLEEEWPPSRVIAVAVMLLACWVNLSVFVIIAPLTLLRLRVIRSSLVTLASGMAGGFLMMIAEDKVNPSARTPLRLLRPAEWPGAWVNLLHSVRTSVITDRFWAVVIVIAAVACTSALLYRRLLSPVRAAGIITAVGILNWLSFGILKWVQLNLYSPRYLYVSLLLFGVAIGMLIAECIQPGKWIAALLLVSAVVLTYGLPSLQKMNSHLDDFGAMTPDIIQSGARVVAGNYWAIWPAVYHANLTLYRRAAHAHVYGLTYRATPTLKFWRDGREKSLVIAARKGDSSLDEYVRQYGLSIRKIGETQTVDLYAID